MLKSNREANTYSNVKHKKRLKRNEMKFKSKIQKIIHISRVKQACGQARRYGHRILFRPFLIYDYYVWLQGATEAVIVEYRKCMVEHRVFWICSLDVTDYLSMTEYAIDYCY